MSNRLIQYGFTAGIVSETLWSQTILQKYGFGLADCQNYIVDFSGMIISRPGTIADTLLPVLPGEPYRLVPFIFAEEDANTFELVFVANRVFFLQRGAYQIESAKTVSAISSTGAYTQINSTAHGYSVGDYVEFYGSGVPAHLRGQIVRVSHVVGANNFQVQPIGLVSSFGGWDNAVASNVNVHRLYSISTPFASGEIAGLKFSQARDEMEITSAVRRPYGLERQEDGTWTIAPKNFVIEQPTPTNLSVVQISPNVGWGTIFVVTSVNAKGEESAGSTPLIALNGGIDGSNSIRIKWNAVPGAVKYNVYRGRKVADISVSAGADVGFVGSTFAANYDDRNETPDFTVTPPSNQNPFAQSGIDYVELTAAGSGYARTDTVSFTDSTGTGATGQLVVDGDTGAVVGVIVTAPGRSYTNPSVVISTSGGSGATFNVVLTPATGRNPRVSTLHQQRKVYGASVRDPMIIWGSTIGLFKNFSTSSIVAADESYEYELSSPIVGEIKHLLSTRSGLLAFSNIGIWSIAGTQNTNITPTDAEASIQTAVGASDLQPILIDSDVLYAEPNNKTIRLLQYNHYSRQFGGMDISVLSRDLFARWNDLMSWSFETRPYKIVWAVRNDGQLLTCTISQEQEVFAWARHNTEGSFEQVITIPETAREVTYVSARRWLTGREVITLEHFADRQQSVNEDHCGVDCAIPFGGTQPNAALTFTPYDIVLAGELEYKVSTVTASSAIFSSADEGKYIKYRDGKGIITDYINPTQVNIAIIYPFTALHIPYSSRLRQLKAGAWWLTELMDDTTLPFNFRPDKVTVFGDGKLFIDVEPTDGVVEFQESLAHGYIGFGYDCVAVTLPFAADGTIIEDSRKKVVGVGIRYVDSKGIEVGTELDDTYPIIMQFQNNMSEASQLRSGHEHIHVAGDWDENARVVMKANGGLPSQITGLVIDLEVGDDVD